MYNPQLTSSFTLATVAAFAVTQLFDILSAHNTKYNGYNDQHCDNGHGDDNPCISSYKSVCKTINLHYLYTMIKPIKAVISDEHLIETYLLWHLF